jgi:hypothetical protein
LGEYARQEYACQCPSGIFVCVKKRAFKLAANLAQ